MSVLENGENNKGKQIISDTDIVMFAEGLDSEEVKILAIISIVASGGAGLVAGVIGGIVGGAIHNYFGIGQVATSQIGNPGPCVQRASDLVGDIQTLKHARNMGSMLGLNQEIAGRFTDIAVPLIFR